MIRPAKTKCIGILTAGGDCPGLNSAIRGIAKVAINVYGMRVIGILDGFRGLVENRTMALDDQTVSGVLTRGGTILGTSRDKPHKMPMGGKARDMTSTAVENVRQLQLDCLVMLGGGGTQKTAQRLREAGINVLTLPKTIDNDVVETDVSFGFDTAMNIATEAIDRLHTTATSHHRIIVCEVMGNRAGWLALGAGIAGGADVILIPEIGYDMDRVGEYLIERRRNGKRFSIMVIAEGARSKREVEAADDPDKKKARKKSKKRTTSAEENQDRLLEEVYRDDTRRGLPLAVRRIQDETMAYHVVQEPMASRIARQVQEVTGVEARVTSLGHVQRGGVPSSFDRMLSTRLGTTAAELLAEGTYNVMVAWQNNKCVPVPLEKVAGFRKTVPLDHEMIRSARLVGISFGD